MSDGEPAPVEVEDVLAALEAAIGQDTAAKTDALRALTVSAVAATSPHVASAPHAAPWRADPVRRLLGGSCAPRPAPRASRCPRRRPQALIDPADEGYSVQRAAAEALLPSVLMQLLDDDEDGVKVEAANALAAMVDHSGTGEAAARMRRAARCATPLRC